MELVTHMLLSNRIDDSEVATLLITNFSCIVPHGGPRVQLMRANTCRVTIIIPHRDTGHGHVARAHHAMQYHVLSVNRLSHHPVRLSGDRRAIDRCETRAGGCRIIDARDHILCISGCRLFGEAVSTRWCSRDKQFLANAKQRDVTDE